MISRFLYRTVLFYNSTLKSGRPFLLYIKIIKKLKWKKKLYEIKFSKKTRKTQPR